MFNFNKKKQMKKFRFYYWKYKNDEYQDFEKDIEGKDFYECCEKFREKNPSAKIRCVNEVL